jgi:hypothetical protein
VWLGTTFETLHGAARAFVAVVWRFDSPRREINFPQIENRVEAKMPAP